MRRSTRTIVPTSTNKVKYWMTETVAYNQPVSAIFITHAACSSPAKKFPTLAPLFPCCRADSRNASVWLMDQNCSKGMFKHMRSIAPLQRCRTRTKWKSDQRLGQTSARLGPYPTFLRFDRPENEKPA